MQSVLVVLFRWLHIIPACLAIGGVFFMRVVLPAGLMTIDDPEQRKAVFLRCRRVFKFVVHPSILFLILSGAFNAWVNWKIYGRAMPASHAFFGTHLLLALAVFAISLTLLAGKEPPASHRQWMTVNLVLLALVVAAGGALKFVRDHAPASPAAVPNLSDARPSP